MSESINSRFLDDPVFQSLLVGCMESLERGETIDRIALARDFPKFAREIGQFLDDRKLLEEVASDFGDVDASRIAISAYEETMASGSEADDFTVGDAIRYIGEYEILEEIARGGMGVVFKARQQTLKRIVALKMILAGRLADSTDVERFQREARAAGKLKHPCIVPIHEIGEHDRRHYFTMDFVEGRSLAEAIREETLAPRAAAKLIQSTAEALQYAHEQGIVHRDLKPANILLDKKNQPHVTDFGLARMLQSVDDESHLELTASGQILGTPSYMSPEQAAGRQDLVSTASDIYSLGAILYASLTGRAPFVADSSVETLLQVMNKEPVSPRVLNPSTPKDLETICLKCLTKEPQKRYGTAQLLAEDLGRYLEGRPVSARPVSVVSKHIRWAKRNRMVASLLALSALLLAGGATLSTYFAFEANERAEAENAQRRRADETVKLLQDANNKTKQALLSESLALADMQNERDEAERQRLAADEMRSLAQRRLEAQTRTLYALQLTRTHDLWKTAPGEAARLLGNEQVCPPDLRDFSWYYLRGLTTRKLEQWEDGAGPINALDVSSDELLFAAGGIGRAVRVYRRGQERPVAILEGHDGWVSSLCFSPDDRFLAVASKKTLTIWNLETQQVERRIDHMARIDCVAYANDGRQLITAGQGLTAWNAQNGEMVKRLAETSREFRHVVSLKDGQSLLTADEEGMVAIWHWDSDAPVREVAMIDDAIVHFDVSDDE